MKGKDPVSEVSNAEIKHILDQTMTRFENWRVEVERKPNPAMIHSLKNIMSIIDTVTSMSDRRMEYSYKALVQRMSGLMHETAELNMAIVNSLKDDDELDEKDLQLVSSRLFKLINAAAELARLVQDHFGTPELLASQGRGLLPAAPSAPAPAKDRAGKAGGTAAKGRGRKARGS